MVPQSCIGDPRLADADSVINVFLELGLPFVLRFVNDWRAGKTTLKEAVKMKKLGADAPPAQSAEEAEKRFMDKVERELALPDYNLFSTSMILGPHICRWLRSAQRTTPRWSRSLAMSRFGVSSGRWRPSLPCSTITLSFARTH